MEPAKVEMKPNEGMAAVVTLTEKADGRLGIEVAAASRQSVRRRRTVGGEVVLPDGAAVIVSAPVAGRVTMAADAARPGSRIEAGAALLTIEPLLSVERDVLTPAERVAVANARVTLVTARVAAEGDVKTAEAQVDGAKITLDRAERLLRDRAGAARDVDDATAALAVAKETLAAAKERAASLKDITLDEPTDGENDGPPKDAAPLPIKTPRAGVLRNLVVADGQLVTAGAPLFEVAGLEALWVRVPVYVGMLEQIPDSVAASVAPLGMNGSGERYSAERVAAPPSADAIAATVDLFFALDNPDGLFRPGERVTVELPLSTDEPRLTIPRTAVLRDIHGATWAYERTAPRTYRRTRVLVDFTEGDTAVLAYGPAEGTEVVTAGAAELFGTEFGAMK